MAKSNEEKIVQAFENAGSGLNPTEFARVLSNGSPQVQYTFYDSMIAYITYKAVFADHYQGDLDREAVVVVCQYLRDCLQDYFPETTQVAKKHHRPELI